MGSAFEANFKKLSVYGLDTQAGELFVSQPKP